MLLLAASTLWLLYPAQATTTEQHECIISRKVVTLSAYAEGVQGQDPEHNCEPDIWSLALVADTQVRTSISDSSTQSPF